MKNNNSDRNHKSMAIQQDNVRINNTNMPSVEHNNGSKVIRTRSWPMGHTPQRLGIIEE